MDQEVPEHLVNDIEAALERDARVNQHEYPVKVWTEGGRIVLDGAVENIAAKRRAVNLARQLAGERCPVLDFLRVAAPVQGELALRDEIANVLSGESVFSEYTLITVAGTERDTVHDAGPEAGRIQAEIHDGTVTLNGHVGSLSHWRLAEVLVWWTAGCQRVDNRLEVIPPEQDNDNEITDAVRMVLEKDPMVHAGQLKIGTAGGVVELDGSLASEEERRLAILDAWYVPGVWDVVSRIQLHG